MRHLFQNRTSLTCARTARTRSTAPLAHGRERRREPESGECGLPLPLAVACPPVPACLPCHPLPCGISLRVGLIVVLEPPVCVLCRGGGRCQGHDEERGAGQSAAGKVASNLCAASSGQLCFPRLRPPAESSALQVCWPQAWFGSGWRIPFSWLHLVCGTGSTIQPWPVNLCLVPDRHWSHLCQKLPPFWKSLPSGTPFLHS